ncbi:MAG: hypothetical protein IKR65_01020, partial [Selenomonadaceae bacterium]|nr:hypothetical protein [Selenomonadaceae bacterium]
SCLTEKSFDKDKSSFNQCFLKRFVVKGADGQRLGIVDHLQEKKDLRRISPCVEREFGSGKT